MSVKINNFYLDRMSFSVKGKKNNISFPAVMGILNITENSFFDGGLYVTEAQIAERVGVMLNEGAAIIDVGAVSTRPGSIPISENEEMEKILFGVEIINKFFPQTIVSIDTYRSKVARKAAEAGAVIINDISGGSLDEFMFETIKQTDVAYVLMHIRGTPETMQLKTDYDDVFNDVYNFLNQKINILVNIGVDKEKIIIDPGFGFGKSLEQNYILLNKLKKFKALKAPILVGLSRKSMIYNVLNLSHNNALNATTVVNTISLLNGASILRVHDVKQAVEAVKIYEKYTSIEKF